MTDQDNSAHGQLNTLWERWFVHAHNGITFREFTEGIGRDLRAIIDGIGQERVDGREQHLLGLLGEAAEWLHDGELRDRILGVLDGQQPAGS